MSRRLLELDPRWTAESAVRHGQGVNFLCPVHGGGCAIPRVHVSFSNPIDGGTPFGANGWQRTGEDFATLTLSPSVNAMEWNEDLGTSVSHWHGYIRDGAVLDA